MKRRTREEGMELVEKYQASGLTHERFAKQTRINVATLRYWLRRTLQAKTGDAPEPVRFIELAPAPGQQRQTPVCIETPTGVVVRLEQLPSAEYLVDLVLGLG